MIQFFKNLLNGKPQPIEEKPKSFTFSTTEIQSVGDKYEYTVEAESKEEAFKKLIEYFFGEGYPNEGIKSKHYTVTRPQNYVFDYENMPHWFAKRLSGYVRDDDHDYQKELEKYCIDKNIKLDKNRL